MNDFKSDLDSITKNSATRSTLIKAIGDAKHQKDKDELMFGLQKLKTRFTQLNFDNLISRISEESNQKKIEKFLGNDCIRTEYLYKISPLSQKKRFDFIINLYTSDTLH